MRRTAVLSLILCLFLPTLFLPVSAGPAQKLLAAGTHTLTYVESSTGLVPPQMEGGRTEVEMGDVNGDGYPDLVSIGDHGSPYVNTDEHGIMVWFGDGAGHWSVFMNGDFGYGGVALGDVNADGLADVGYGMHHNYSGNDFGDQILEVALGDGTGHNWTPWDDGLATNGEDWGMFGSDLADVDNDGDLDLGSISFGCCAGVHVYRNQSDGTWQQSFGFLGGNSQDDFVFGDVSGDGNADFAVSHQYGTVYLGDGAGGFALGDGNLPPPGSSGHAGVSLGDVNGDGRADLAFCNDSGGVEVWGWTGPGTWQDLSGSLPASGPYEAAQLFDMDMDGHLDVAAFGTGQVRIWGGDGAGGWSEIAAFNTPAPGYLSAFRVGGDADHNGYPDIVLVAEEGSWPNEQNHAHFYQESSTPTALEIKPVFPRGQETFQAGATIFVDWISAVPAGGPGTVSLELSTHGPAGPWLPIAADLPNGGRYQWRIPPGTPSTNEAYIRYTLVVSPDVAVATTPNAFNILGSFEEPIYGLEATNDSPTPLGQPTHFTATVVSGTNVTYAWAFGDGVGGSGQSTAHVYPDLGFYTATVTATNSISQATATTPVTITEVPIAGLAAANDSPTALGRPTAFTATVLSGTNVAFTWTFGDGSPPLARPSSLVDGPSSTVTHTYAAPGTYTATVTASNAVSAVTATTPVLVEEAVAGLSAANDGPTTLGRPTTFTATVLSGTNVTYAWAFGDGSPPLARPSSLVDGPSSTVTHTYAAPGTYTATVTASNAVSAVTATTPVLVEEAVAGLSAANDGPTTLGRPTTFTATVLSGTNVTYAWAFSDGSPPLACPSSLVDGPSSAVTHTYAAPGTYTATVTASNAVSAVTATTPVLVEEAVAGLEATSDSPTALGQPTTFTATVLSGTNVAFTWTFGDGSPPLARPSSLVDGPSSAVTHTYAAPGTYTATVTASNAVSSMTAATVVEVVRPAWCIYLPLVVRAGG
jgi:PKD repeat protein